MHDGVEPVSRAPQRRRDGLDEQPGPVDPVARKVARRGDAGHDVLDRAGDRLGDVVLAHLVVPVEEGGPADPRQSGRVDRVVFELPGDGEPDVGDGRRVVGGDDDGLAGDVGDFQVVVESPCRRRLPGGAREAGGVLVYCPQRAGALERLVDAVQGHLKHFLGNLR